MRVSTVGPSLVCELSASSPRTQLLKAKMIEEFDLGTQFKVIGVGGGGGNAVDHMIAQGVQGVEFVCENTDAQALHRSRAHHLIQLGCTGLGAGAKPEAGREAAEEAVDRIRDTIKSSRATGV